MDPIGEEFSELVELDFEEVESILNALEEEMRVKEPREPTSEEEKQVEEPREPEREPTPAEIMNHVTYKFNNEVKFLQKNFRIKVMLINLYKKAMEHQAQGQ